MQSRITEVDPPRRLSFTWNNSGNVTFEPEQKDNNVLLTVTHRRLTDAAGKTNLRPPRLKTKYQRPGDTIVQ